MRILDDDDLLLFVDIVERREPELWEQMKLGHKLRQQRRALGIDPLPQFTVAELEAHDAWLLEIKLLLSKLKISEAERAIRDAEYERKRRE